MTGSRNIFQQLISASQRISLDSQLQTVEKLEHFAIYSDRLVGLVGNAGAGKTTLLQLLSESLPKSIQTILVDCRDSNWFGQILEQLNISSTAGSTSFQFGLAQVSPNQDVLLALDNADDLTFEHLEKLSEKVRNEHVHCVLSYQGKSRIHQWFESETSNSLEVDVLALTPEESVMLWQQLASIDSSIGTSSLSSELQRVGNPAKIIAEAQKFSLDRSSEPSSKWPFKVILTTFAAIVFVLLISLVLYFQDDINQSITGPGTAQKVETKSNKIGSSSEKKASPTGGSELVTKDAEPEASSKSGHQSEVKKDERVQVTDKTLVTDNQQPLSSEKSQSQVKPTSDSSSTDVGKNTEQASDKTTVQDSSRKIVEEDSVPKSDSAVTPLGNSKDTTDQLGQEPKTPVSDNTPVSKDPSVSKDTSVSKENDALSPATIGHGRVNSGSQNSSSETLADVKNGSEKQVKHQQEPLNSESDNQPTKSDPSNSEKVTTTETKTPARNDRQEPTPIAQFNGEEQYLLSLDKGLWFVQLAGFEKLPHVVEFLESNQSAGELHFYRTVRNGKNWHVIILGPFSAQPMAEQAIKRLPERLRKTSPWIKAVSQVQREIRLQSSISN